MFQKTYFNFTKKYKIVLYKKIPSNMNFKVDDNCKQTTD